MARSKPHSPERSGPMSAFFSPYSHQFARVAVCVPQVAVADPAKNGDQVASLFVNGDRDGAAVMLFPELCLSAYAIDDLLFQDALLDAVTGEIAWLIALSRESTLGVAAGAEILLNLSASNITIGKAQMRRLLCASQSARCIAAYAYSAAGAGESTTDLAWDGQAGIFEIGDGLAETERFSAQAEMAVADIDLGRIRQERMRTNTFGDNARLVAERLAPFRRVGFAGDAPKGTLDLRGRG